MDGAPRAGHSGGMTLLLILILAAFPAAAPAQDRAGDFDYYLLSLSWHPAWCRLTGDGRAAAECAPGSGQGFTVHGLWPQYERGYPADCATGERDPSRREVQAVADLMPPGLALYQWRKHGRCSGLSAPGYFDTLREAAERVAIPAAFDDLDRDMSLPPAVIEQAFIAANPDLSPDGVTVSCKSDALQEVRICLTRDLQPRDCAPDVRPDCRLPRVLMEQVR